ncbi:hypothetical protein AB0P17_33315 [Streptomyces sp. NPDC088124]|uniref:hypothetical protein n=1 Tax=Streptomyces sp. NPDC088124 TaxID=3154654 RepID=UPI003434CB39
MNRIRKTFTTLTIAAATTSSAAVLALFAVATPASAWSWDCQEYLRGKGYNVPVGGNAAKACTIAEDGEGSTNSLSICLSRLEALGVSNSHAKAACRLGAAR